MAKNLESIERDIERARDQLAVTLDELAERANPQSLVDHVKSLVLNWFKKPAVAGALGGVALVAVVFWVRGLRKRR